MKIHAFIDEQACIGCTLCLQACPVDAILGAAKQMHTVIVDECTGCQDCVASCPVDCIQMRPFAHQEWSAELKAQKAERAERRHAAQTARRERLKRERAARLQRKQAASEKAAAIEAAIQRVAAKKAAQGSAPKNTGQLSKAQQAQIDRVDRRREPAATRTDPATDKQTGD